MQLEANQNQSRSAANGNPGVNYNFVDVDGHQIFYREAGSHAAQTIVLLHGFPSSSHMFRDLIPELASHFHVIAPDYLGFGYSAQPSAAEFQYTFESLTAIVERLLFEKLELTTFAIYVQDYGGPVGFRIASRHPEAISGIIVQNGNAYAEGISATFDLLKPFWAGRTRESEKVVRSLLLPETTRFQYTHGSKNINRISPDSYTFDQLFLEHPGNDAIQLDLFYDYPSNVLLYDEWHEYFRTHHPRTLIVWGQNDAFFTVEGAKAFLADLPNAQLHFFDTGHFALEEHHYEISKYIIQFLTEESEVKSNE